MPSADFIRQVCRFAIVGVTATLVHYVVALGASTIVGPYAGNVCGFLTAVLVSYLGHRHFTFGSDGRHRRQLPQFLVSALTGLAAGQLVLAIGLAAGLAPALALAFAAAAPPPVTFVLSRFWVFAPERRVADGRGKEAGPIP